MISGITALCAHLENEGFRPEREVLERAGEGQTGHPKLFCIPESRGRIYCTESIKRMVEEAGLKGMRFDLLYEFS